jgi:hypothetical protein
MRWTLPFFVALVAMILLSLAGAAGARSFSINENEFAIQWVDPSGRLEFRNNAGLPPVTCKFTMAGRFSTRTFNKTRGSVIGSVESASVERAGATSGTCRNGEVTILTATLPWNITYRAFFGTLPRIRTVVINIVNVAVRVSFEESLICLFRSESAEPVVGFIAVEPTNGSAGPFSPDGEIASADIACSMLGFKLNLGGPGGYESRHGAVVTVSLI